MSFSCKMLNKICCLLYRRESRRFDRTCNLEKVQTDYLRKLLRENADTEYGRKYGFSGIDCYEDFAQKVPLVTYEDLEPYIESMAHGQKSVLTAEPVTLFELTSGSVSGKKLIPYTPSLKREFQRGVKPWLYNLYTKVPGVDSGKSYWSITPITSAKTFTSAGIPIGFEADAEYFGKLEQLFMQRIFAVDGSVKFSDSMEKFYFDTATQLLACSELTLISVWSPTFLAILCDFIRGKADELAGKLPKEKRQAFLDAIGENRFDMIFPDLKIISCWADGSAADFLEPVKVRFPGVYIQPKGLLATECLVSFPVIGEEGSRLSIYSHFFEFRRISSGEILPAHLLTEGEYEVIVTTGGGLYRYCMGDIVEILQTYQDRPPRLRFQQRGGSTSDLFGEKLTEPFVREVCEKLHLAENFSLLAPEGNQYCLYTTAGHVEQTLLEEELCRNYHYQYCRTLGQLKEAKVIMVGGDPKKDYIRRLSQEGMRIGDIKPAYLSNRSHWHEYFNINENEIDEYTR